MGTLMFECPATGMEVSTGIEVDTASFGASPSNRLSSLSALPHPSPDAAVRTWLSKGTENSSDLLAIPDDVQTAPVSVEKPGPRQFRLPSSSDLV